MRKKTRKKLKEVRLLEKLELNHTHRTTWRDEFAKHKDNSVKEASVLGLLEFVAGYDRGLFMDELWRVLVPEGKATIICAYWNTAQGTQDFLYEYPPLCEQSFLFFNKAWREANKLTDRGLTCDFDFCVDPDTLVFTSDLRWEQAGKIKIGEVLIGVEEYAKGNWQHRRLLESTVEFTRAFKHQRVKVSTDCGVITATPEHPFLARTRERAYDWVPAAELTPQHIIKFVGQPWEYQREDSWLAGMFDGEGCVVLPKREDRYTGVNLTISQRPGQTLDKAVDTLSKEIGSERVAVYNKGEGSGDCKTICVSGISPALRLLGIYRPVRLLKKIQSIIQSGDLGLPHLSATVMAVESLADGEVVAIRTSSRTLITNGFVSHNTYGYAPTAETAAKSDETRSFAIRCYNNAVQNLQLMLTKRPA
jgi:hypothetical protein